MLDTGTSVTVHHAMHWYHSHSPSCYTLVPLSQSNMLRTGTIVTVQQDTHWYNSHSPTCYTLAP
ncbi:hypothetical protein DPMN_035505 [Dreissena polymorpha]|uniref:Uncharacterized protein n=1 Tax=Dreissena polymorpha TaxID=45954 RepID=A0A9D4M9P8_DREPO|nr:hypothetical protein DPMN_035505 [Dreissena polymorpha]